MLPEPKLRPKQQTSRTPGALLVLGPPRITLQEERARRPRYLGSPEASGVNLRNFPKLIRELSCVPRFVPRTSKNHPDGPDTTDSEPCIYGLLRSGEVLLDPQGATHNPSVVGSSPTRLTAFPQVRTGWCQVLTAKANNCIELPRFVLRLGAAPQTN